MALRQAREVNSAPYRQKKDGDPLTGSRRPRLSLSLYRPSVARNWLPPTATPDSLEAPAGAVCCEEERGKLYGEVDEAEEVDEWGRGVGAGDQNDEG